MLRDNFIAYSKLMWSFTVFQLSLEHSLLIAILKSTNESKAFSDHLLVWLKSALLLDHNSDRPVGKIRNESDKLCDSLIEKRIDCNLICAIHQSI